MPAGENDSIANAQAAYQQPAVMDTQVAADIVANGFPMAMRCGEYKPGDAAYAAVYLPYAGQYRMFFETLERKNDNAEVWAEMDAYGFNVIMCNTNIYELTRFIADRYFS